MDYTSIHIYGHLLSDDILRSIEQDNNMLGNRQQDFGLEASTSSAIDYVWSSLRNDWNFFQEHSSAKDPYGTRRARDLMERLMQNLGYELEKQSGNISVGEKSFDINYLCSGQKNLPVIVIGDKIIDQTGIDTLDKCSLDYRAKGSQRRRSAHATMLEYLNSTENIYGIISNGHTIRLIRNSGQLVKLTYIEFDLRRMLEEDKYTEFCLMFRLLHSSRFNQSGDEQSIIERWFNMSIESGNRIRAGLSTAVQRTMETIGNAVVCGHGTGNNVLREAIISGECDAYRLNKELIHFIYRLLFLFIIEERGLVYNIPEDPSNPEYKKLCRHQELYKQYYAASRLRPLSELNYLKRDHYHDLWSGLMDTFRLFETEEFGASLSIKPLGGVLFNVDTLHYLKSCTVSNRSVLEAFSALNEFRDENDQRVKINYSSLDVEEFGSVYEGILEMSPFLQQGTTLTDWQFGFVGGLDRQSTSSYYTRPDLVQSLIKTTLEPVIKERIAKCPTPEEKVKSLLSMKVCDAASGSGHIVLAMARTIAWYVCTIRSGEDNPASLDYREALREVIQKCIYAVDYNPDAVELCKVVLWIEGYCAGKPLSFLDHHIRCGNSVVGVTDLDMLLKGVPNDAFAAVDKDTLKQVKKLNASALTTITNLHSGNGGEQMELFNKGFSIENIDSEQIGLADQVKAITSMPEESLLEALTKQTKWEHLMDSPRVECLRRACDIYTYAFYKQYTAEDVEESLVDNVFSIPDIPYTRTVYHALEEIKKIESPDINFTPLTDNFKKEVDDIARKERFFHWCVEFPEVFSGNGGFDVMCGNPPWDKLQMEDEKWFSGKDEAIVKATNQASRKRLISALETTNPSLYAEYVAACREIASQSNYVKNSGRFPLTACGKIDLYPLFAEHCLNCSNDSWGLVMPTGIAINDSTKNFFAKLVDENRLISLYDFENKEALFDIHRMFKFCLLSAGKAQNTPRKVRGGFFLTRIEHLTDPNRIYTINTADFAVLNPNTKTCPVFRTSMDATITTRIYHNSSVLINDTTSSNPWGCKLSILFNMASDSEAFKEHSNLISGGELQSNGFFVFGNSVYSPLYEGKMIWLYNHHYGEWPTEGERPNSIPSPSIGSLRDSYSPIMPWYWIDSELVKRRTEGDGSSNEWTHNWFFGYRKISNATNERTFICSIYPYPCGAGDSIINIYIDSAKNTLLCQSVMSSIVFDYAVRQKMGGSNMNNFITKQLPVLTPEQFSKEDEQLVIRKAVELLYFNHDLDGWAEELWNELNEEQKKELPELGAKEPFIYDPDKRAILQAELDAIFAHLYGLSTEDLRYILDPEDVCGVGCINETFRVLKDNEIREFGEYRTKRLVMDAWYKFGYNK